MPVQRSADGAVDVDLERAKFADAAMVIGSSSIPPILFMQCPSAHNYGTARRREKARA